MLRAGDAPTGSRPADRVPALFERVLREEHGALTTHLDLSSLCSLACLCRAGRGAVEDTRDDARWAAGVAALDADLTHGRRPMPFTSAAAEAAGRAASAALIYDQQAPPWTVQSCRQEKAREAHDAACDAEGEARWAAHASHKARFLALGAWAAAVVRSSRDGAALVCHRTEYPREYGCSDEARFRAKWTVERTAFASDCPLLDTIEGLTYRRALEWVWRKGFDAGGDSAETRRAREDDRTTEEEACPFTRPLFDVPARVWTGSEPHCARFNGTEPESELPLFNHRFDRHELPPVNFCALVDQAFCESSELEPGVLESVAFADEGLEICDSDAPLPDDTMPGSAAHVEWLAAPVPFAAVTEKLFGLKCVHSLRGLRGADAEMPPGWRAAAEAENAARHAENERWNAFHREEAEREAAQRAAE